MLNKKLQFLGPQGDVLHAPKKSKNWILSPQNLGYKKHHLGQLTPTFMRCRGAVVPLATRLELLSEASQENSLARSTRCEP